MTSWICCAAHGRAGGDSATPVFYRPSPNGHPLGGSQPSRGRAIMRDRCCVSPVRPYFSRVRVGKLASRRSCSWQLRRQLRWERDACMSGESSAGTWIAEEDLALLPVVGCSAFALYIFLRHGAGADGRVPAEATMLQTMMDATGFSRQTLERAVRRLETVNRL